MSESIDERYQQFMTVPIGKHIGTTTLVYDMHAEIGRLRREKAALVEALEFYADPDTYVAMAFNPDPPCGDFIEDFSDDHGEKDDFRPGKRARAALRAATGDMPSVNWKHGEAYSYCPECGRQEPLRRSATETKGEPT